MFVHSVYFWLKPNLTPEQLSLFVERATALTTLPSVKHGWVGKPAATDRPVIDRTYSYGLVVVFDDEAGHDAYQVHPIHDAFRELHDMWTAVKIYDFE
jgi:Stress responsive A/B Barrel Domain